jgi:hypothetical protein
MKHFFLITSLIMIFVLASAKGQKLLPSNDNFLASTGNINIPMNQPVLNFNDFKTGEYTGDIWKQYLGGMDKLSVLSVCKINNLLVAGTQGNGIYLSTDYGSTWKASNSGLANKYVKSLIIKDNVIFAGTTGGIFKSTDYGTNWVESNSGMSNFDIRKLMVMGNNIIAGSYSGVFKSVDNGVSWAEVSVGLTNKAILSMAGKDNTLYAGTNGGGVFISIDEGSNWSALNNGLKNKYVRSLNIAGSVIYAGTDGNGVFQSIDNCQNWTNTTTGLTDKFIISIGNYGNNIFVGTSSGGVFYSSDNGSSWNEINTGLTNKSVLSLSIIDEYLYCGTMGGLHYAVVTDIISGVDDQPGLPKGINENSIQIYPTPATDIIHVSINASGSSNLSMKITDNLGNTVMDNPVLAIVPGLNNFNFDIANLSAGIYYFSLVGESSFSTKKFIIVK